MELLQPGATSRSLLHTGGEGMGSAGLARAGMSCTHTQTALTRTSPPPSAHLMYLLSRLGQPGPPLPPRGGHAAPPVLLVGVGSRAKGALRVCCWLFPNLQCSRPPPQADSHSWPHTQTTLSGSQPAEEGEGASARPSGLVCFRDNCKLHSAPKF